MIADPIVLAQSDVEIAVLQLADNMKDDEITHLKKMGQELVTALDQQKEGKNVERIKPSYNN